MASIICGIWSLSGSNSAGNQCQIFVCNGIGQSVLFHLMIEKEITFSVLFDIIKRLVCFGITFFEFPFSVRQRPAEKEQFFFC